MRTALGLILALLTACVTRGLPAEALVRDVEERTRRVCGATFSLTDGDLTGTGLYAVGAYPEPERGRILDHFPSAAEIRAFVDDHQTLLAAPKHALGTYCEGAGGATCQRAASVTCWVDITRVTGNLDAAVSLARACNQKAIARLHRDGVELIDQIDGKRLGDGAPLAGGALSGCERARSAR